MKTVVVDIETTGLPAKGANYEVDYMFFPYIVTLAWKINDQETRGYTINQEGREIPQQAIDVHGITNEIAAASPHKLHEILPMFLFDAMGNDIAIGHNIYFDSSIIKANILRLIDAGSLQAEFYKIMQEILHKDKRVDTMQKTIKFCNLGGKWPKLTELYMKLFGETFNAHSSIDDVEATYKCYRKLMELKVIG